MVKLVIRLYQLTRILRPSCCRFYPSCSDYALEAIEKHGLARGIGLTLARLLKCHPWHIGGVDLVPDVCHAVGARFIRPRMEGKR